MKSTPGNVPYHGTSTTAKYTFLIMKYIWIAIQQKHFYHTPHTVYHTLPSVLVDRPTFFVISSEPLLSTSACPDCSNAFSLSILSINIFFLMASILADLGWTFWSEKRGNHYTSRGKEKRQHAGPTKTEREEGERRTEGHRWIERESPNSDWHATGVFIFDRGSWPLPERLWCLTSLFTALDPMPCQSYPNGYESYTYICCSNVQSAIQYSSCQIQFECRP